MSEYIAWKLTPQSACACVVFIVGAPYNSQSRLAPYDPDQGSQLGSYNAGYDGSQSNLGPPQPGSQSKLDPPYGSQSNLNPPYNGSQPGSQSNLAPYNSQYDRRTPSPYGGSQQRLGGPGDAQGSQSRLEPPYGSQQQLGSSMGSQSRLAPGPYGSQSGSQQLPPYGPPEDEIDAPDRVVPLEHMGMLGTFDDGRAPSSGSVNRGQGMQY